MTRPASELLGRGEKASGYRSGAVWLLLVALAGGADAQEPRADSLLLGAWSAEFAGSRWQVDVGPNRRYRIWQVERTRDTLVASMGRWEVRETTDEVCFLPVGRRAMCSPLMLVNMGRQAGYRWRFEDPTEDGIRFVAYRMGRAPWDPDGSVPVYSLDEVERRPRLLGCPVLPRLPSGETRTRRVYAEMVVEPDSTATAIHIVDAPDRTLMERALETVRSCRFVPGRNAGAAVRVRVRLPIDFQPTP